MRGYILFVFFLSEVAPYGPAVSFYCLFVSLYLLFLNNDMGLSCSCILPKIFAIPAFDTFMYTGNLHPLSRPHSRFEGTVFNHLNFPRCSHMNDLW